MNSKILALFLVLPAVPLRAAEQRPQSANEIVDQVIAAEGEFLARIVNFHPLVETYVQFFREEDSGQTIADDSYFIGKLNFTQGVDFESLNTEKTSFISRLQFLKKTDRVRLLPRGFVQMALIDGVNFNRDHYEFEGVHREFLGEVRCIVFDVKPKPKEPEGHFIGRVWAEDRDFNVVRFSGTYTSRQAVRYLHFNSYRAQIGPGLWLPSMIYVEQSFKGTKLPRNAPTILKGQVRLWSYASAVQQQSDTFTNILVEAPETPKDHSATEVSRTEALREWQRQAAENTLKRMEKAGLVGPEGEMEKVLDTVLDNLVITNKIVVDPPVRCRVLLTTPLESFAVGHNILVSRGLIDVLPNEASLAAVIARELGDIVLGRNAETMNAFSDRMLFDDKNILRQFSFRRSGQDEENANRKAMELLKNSPYKDQLPSVGLFLTALNVRLAAVPNLLRAEVGNPIAETPKLLLLPDLAQLAPRLDPDDIRQIPALPLGSRLRLEAWDNHTELVNAKPVAILSRNEKLPFEVTPLVEALKRQK